MRKSSIFHSISCYICIWPVFHIWYNPQISKSSIFHSISCHFCIWSVFHIWYDLCIRKSSTFQSVSCSFCIWPIFPIWYNLYITKSSSSHAISCSFSTEMFSKENHVSEHNYLFFVWLKCAAQAPHISAKWSSYLEGWFRAQDFPQPLHHGY